MPNYAKLSSFNEDGDLNMVVETPRGSTVKLRNEPDTKVFTVSRALTLGLSYPFDWGFIPGTKAEDGDPVDALAVHDSATYPGVLLPCRAQGVVDVSQKGEKGREENPRLILMPSWHERMGEFEKATGLPKRAKKSSSSLSARPSSPARTRGLRVGADQRQRWQIVKEAARGSKN
jgi:inorganic pyrophosphatase